MAAPQRKPGGKVVSRDMAPQREGRRVPDFAPVPQRARVRVWARVAGAATRDAGRLADATLADRPPGGPAGGAALQRPLQRLALDVISD